ncbi:secreted protein, partial [Streptomyces sviceus ATCC 29083]
MTPIPTSIPTPLPTPTSHRRPTQGRVAAMRYKLTFVVGLTLGYVLGTRAGRERYEQLKKSARQVAQNPAVRNTAETAAQQGRQFAGKAYHVVSDKGGRPSAGVRDPAGA